ncbi:MAG TPA: hypothetical protein VFK05_35060 [Polyangiaceae bacterium]|nr:hypothetical protein [Polyangiaceae bacterium]
MMSFDLVRRCSVGRELKTKTIRRAFAIDRSSLRQVLWSLPVIGVISVYYWFMASSGTFHDNKNYTAYYDMLAEGFRHGHLYIVTQPSAQLLAKTDPFAFENIRLWLWDVSLYKGHYYMYWGPVPALFMLAYKVVTGTQEQMTDQWLTAIFMLGRFWAGAGLILSFVSRLKHRQPTWVVCLAIAVFGLGNPSPFIVARPCVYEACLIGGGCFVFCGMFFAFWGLEAAGHRKLFFLAAGLSWSLAIGCRVTNLLCVPILMLISAGFAWYRSNRSRSAFIAECLIMGVPVTLTVLALGWYNYARFDSPTDFGVSYQLTMQPFFGYPAYIWPNVYSYLFGPLKWSCHFPFAKITGYRALSSLVNWPQGYLTFERVAGIMITTTWAWFSLFGIWRVIDYLLTRRRRPHASNAAAELTATEVWFLTCSVATMAAVVPALTLWEASMRYVEDAAGGLLLLATLGVFWLLRRTYLDRRNALGLAVRGLVVVLGAQTCIIGALNGFSSYDDSFKYVNPILFEKIESALSVCPKSKTEEQ